VRQATGDGVPRATLAAAAPAPAVRLLDRVVGDPAGQHRPIRLEVLADHHQTQLVEAAERRHIRGREGSVRHVEVFLASLEPLRDLSYEPPQAIDRGRLGRRT
jgi:hypothetical protein